MPPLTQLTPPPRPPFWQEYWYVIGLVVAFVIIVISVIIRVLTPATPPPNQANTWNQVTPGYSTLSQVEQHLGQPLKTEATADGIKVDYGSAFPDFPNQVIADQNNTVRFIKEFIKHDPGHTLAKYTNEFGQPDFSLYDEASGNSVQAHVFLKQGLVIIAHVEAATVEQKWYFEPTTRENFLNSWGQGLREGIEGPEPLEQ